MPAVLLVVTALVTPLMSTATLDECWRPPPDPGPCRDLVDGHILAVVACASCLVQILRSLPDDVLLHVGVGSESAG